MKTYIKRALRTFAQTAVGYISVNICNTDRSSYTNSNVIIEYTKTTDA